MIRSCTILGTASLTTATMLLFAFGPVRQQSSGHPRDRLIRADAVVPLAAGSVELPIEAVSKEGAKRLTGRGSEDDFPVLTKAADGTIWLVYVEYQPGGPIIMEQVRNRRFDSLVTKGNGDSIRLMRFDGKTWQPPINVTERGLDVWRPTLSVDGDGNVVVAWSENVDGDWEIFYRKYTPAKTSGKQGRWSHKVRVTDTKGSDFHVVSATDAEGSVWLAWQGWREDNFDIQLSTIGRDGSVKPADRAKRIPNTKRNEWSPAIAADSRGNVYIAWDTYDKGNYDVRLQVIGGTTKTVNVADSARFEARANLLCDADDRLWIAYVEGDEQWGKDSSVPVWFRDRGQKDPAFGLYDRRTVKVKCLAGGKLMQPAGKLERAFAGKLDRNKSLPRLAVDAAGGIWLAVRHHPLSSGRGEAWHSFVTRYDGKAWSPARRLPHSSNLLDNRPALVAFDKGILSVYSSDSRTQTRDRDQNDLFAAVLNSSGKAAPPELISAEPSPKPKLPVFHPQEKADLARMRGFRLRAGSKQLRLLRGDFHRHTEYTAHRDGDGLLEDSWRYALDAARLDWMGNGDHDLGYGFEYYWWQIQKVTDLFHNPPHFIAAQTYERSVTYPSGHRNVMFPKRGIRALPRISKNKRLLFGTARTGSPDVKLLYDYLRRFGGICASHTSGTGMGTDWRDNDAEVEPIVEIFQGCRQMYQSYEHLGAPRAAPARAKPGKYDNGYVWNALSKGHRLGFQSSSDHFSTHISYAVVLTEDVSRQGIIAAFQKRRCYAANDNIVLVVRSGDHLMGEEFKTDKPPSLQISVHGARPIAKVHVIRNNKYVYTAEPKQQKVDLRYTDADAKPGESYYYYVRVEQLDGSLAWASPIWITYK